MFMTRQEKAHFCVITHAFLCIAGDCTKKSEKNCIVLQGTLQLSAQRFIKLIDLVKQLAMHSTTYV